MTSTAPDIAHRFAAAFNARDIEQVLNCFTQDAMYHDLFYGRFARPGLSTTSAPGSPATPQLPWSASE